MSAVNGANNSQFHELILVSSVIHAAKLTVFFLTPELLKMHVEQIVIAPL